MYAFIHNYTDLLMPLLTECFIFQGADGLPGSPGDPGEPGLPGHNGTAVSIHCISPSYAFLPELVLPSTGHSRTAW